MERSVSSKMIILIEPQCIGWQHESVNAGFIENIKKVVGNEKIKVYAEREHINCLRKLLPGIEGEIDFSPIDIPGKNFNYATHILAYGKLFQKIMEDSKQFNIRAVFLLSCNKGNLLAINRIMSEYKSVSFYIVVHGIMEQIVNKSMVPKHTIISFKRILNLFADIDNVMFITYSPKAKDILSNTLGNTLTNRFRFLHLPFPTCMEANKKLSDDGKIHVAILGACANKTAHDFIKLIDSEIKGKVVFDILLRNRIDFSDLESVNIAKTGKNITYFEIMQMISRSNFTFIPYTHEEYQVSSSGILMNSIQQATPVLSFDTNSSLWYNQYNIGKVCTSYDEMREFLTKLGEYEDGLWDVYQHNISDLRENIIQENEDIIMKILSNK